jgi:hypothetical protein
MLVIEDWSAAIHPSITASQDLHSPITSCITVDLGCVSRPIIEDSMRVRRKIEVKMVVTRATGDNEDGEDCWNLVSLQRQQFNIHPAL